MKLKDFINLCLGDLVEFNVLYKDTSDFAKGTKLNTRDIEKFYDKEVTNFSVYRDQLIIKVGDR